MLSGAAGGSVGCVVAYPLDLIKTRLMSQLRAHEPASDGGYRGITDAARQIWRNSGIRGLYCGLGATLFQARPLWSISTLPSERNIAGCFAARGKARAS